MPALIYPNSAKDKNIKRRKNSKKRQDNKLKYHPLTVRIQENLNAGLHTKC